MRHEALFYKLFPPPNFLRMSHAGLEISDDALRCIEYRTSAHGLVVSKYSKLDFPPNLIEAGDVKDEKIFTETIRAFVKSNKLSYVKVSLPEEKVYLFQTEIPSREVKAITQHVEFKLEENVPLSAADSVFYFDILPSTVTGNTLKASVSVAPRIYVEKLLSVLHKLNLVPMAFEVAPKSIAKAVVPSGSDETYLIVHVMNKKTGIYIVSGGVVCFSSTIAWGSKIAGTFSVDPVLNEIHRVHAYWLTRPDTHSALAEVILVGSDMDKVEQAFRSSSKEGLPPIALGNTWANAFDVNRYIPPISCEESLEYAVAAGLALP